MPDLLERIPPACELHLEEQRLQDRLRVVRRLRRACQARDTQLMEERRGAYSPQGVTPPSAKPAASHQ